MVTAVHLGYDIVWSRGHILSNHHLFCNNFPPQRDWAAHIPTARIDNLPHYSHVEWAIFLDWWWLLTSVLLRLPCLDDTSLSYNVNFITIATVGGVLVICLGYHQNCMVMVKWFLKKKVARQKRFKSVVWFLSNLFIKKNWGTLTRC